MEQLFKLKDSLMGYLSPAKRRHTVLLATPPSKPSKIRGPNQPMTEPRNYKGNVVINGRVSKKYLSPSDTKRYPRISRSRPDNDMEDNDGLEVEQDSMTQISHIVIKPEDSSSQIISPSDGESSVSVSAKEDEDSVLHEESEFEEESELDARAKVHQFLDNQTELARHREALERIKDGEWHEDEAALFMRLSMRGFEPLIPRHWNFDFRTCPPNVFSNDAEEPLISAKSGNEFRGTNALLSLVSLGGRVRSLLECRKPQEQLIKKEIENYIKWSERDGGYTSKRFIPLHCIVAGHAGQALPAISTAITDQMQFLASKHRAALALSPPYRIDENSEPEIYSKPPPVVHGIIVAKCIAVFLTLDSRNPDAQPKTIAHFDFSDKNMDVWNAFAVAILVCMVRNHLMASKNDMDNETEDTDNDPDD